MQANEELKYNNKAAAVTEGWMKVVMECSNWSVHNIHGQIDSYCGCSEITLSDFYRSEGQAIGNMLAGGWCMERLKLKRLSFGHVTV